MLAPTTIERLRSFRLGGFIDALNTIGQSAQFKDLGFEDRLTLLVDAEHSRRLDMRTQRLLRAARLNCAASIDNVDFDVPRGLQKKQLLELAQGDWVQQGGNLIVTGPTGIGKTFLATALAHSLCRSGFTVRFQRTHQWLADFAALEEQRRFLQALTGYRKIQLVVFDEWMRDPISLQEARHLLDFIDDRLGRLSCLFIGQIPVASWHSRFTDPTLADAILDRLVHTAVRLELSGDSMRKPRSKRKGGDVASLRKP